MALRVIRETGRTAAYDMDSGATIISGQPLMLASATELAPFDGTAGAQPLGLALEDSQVPDLQNMSGPTAGVGYDYTNFARGGKFSMLTDGGEVELFDDGRGAPFETGDTFALNMPVYANSDGLITSDDNSGGNPQVGVCTGVTGSPVTLLRVKLTI